MPSRKTTEFDLIARIRSRVRDSDPGLLVGIGDDAAVFMPEPGHALVTTTDSLVAGRHFEADWPVQDLGHLAMAVNLSDLAAMGARPRWALLALTLPKADPAWIDAFLDGFLRLAASSGTTLIGGNLAAGPLNLGVQLIGEIDPGQIARRQAARAGDCLVVTGTLGDAAAALRLGDRAGAALTQRLRRPEPRLAAGPVLARQVNAMMDVSDGLLADLGHLLPAGLGAELDLQALPSSRALRSALADEEQRWSLQLSGGNDYELLASVEPGRVPALARQLDALGLALSSIGRIEDEPGIRCRLPGGELLQYTQTGWDHFAA